MASRLQQQLREKSGLFQYADLSNLEIDNYEPTEPIDTPNSPHEPLEEPGHQPEEEPKRRISQLLPTEDVDQEQIAARLATAQNTHRARISKLIRSRKRSSRRNVRKYIPGAINSIP